MVGRVGGAGPRSRYLDTRAFGRDCCHRALPSASVTVVLPVAVEGVLRRGACAGGFGRDWTTVDCST